MVAGAGLDLGTEDITTASGSANSSSMLGIAVAVPELVVTAERESNTAIARRCAGIWTGREGLARNEGGQGNTRGRSCGFAHRFTARQLVVCQGLGYSFEPVCHVHLLVLTLWRMSRL